MVMSITGKIMALLTTTSTIKLLIIPPGSSQDLREHAWQKHCKTNRGVGGEERGRRHSAADFV